MAAHNTPQSDQYVYETIDTLTGPRKSLALDLNSYSTGALQVVADGVVTDLALAWEGSLVDDDASYVPFITGVVEADLAAPAPNKTLWLVPAGIRFARANVSALTGKIRVVGHGIKH